MQVILVIPWISNLVTLPLELVLQPHVHGVSKSTNTPVIMKIWLRKNSNINILFFYFLYSWYLFQWFANLTKIWILKYKYLFFFFLTEKINLLLVKQKNFDQSNFFYSVWNWFWGAEVNNNKYLKFHQLSKSLDEIPRTLI